MSPGFQALCYLAAWEAGLPIPGGLAHGEALRHVALDYSWPSLARIDGFLDTLRDEARPQRAHFLDAQANTNLLYLLAFYVGEVRARTAGVPARWASWQEALREDPATRLFGEGFHSSVLQRAPGCFLPLVSICARLFDGADEKSVQFSAGLGLPPAGERPLPPLPPVSLIEDFPAAFAGLRAAFRADCLDPEWPDWFAGDALGRLRQDTPALLRGGRMVWGAVVQAHNGLFDGSVAGAPLEILYDPRGLAPPEDLLASARSLFELKGRPLDDPLLQPYADHLQDERTRRFGWRVPAAFLPYPLFASSSFIDVRRLPGERLVFPVLPILVADDCPGSVAIAPWELWPAEVFARWAQALQRERPYLMPQPGPSPIVLQPSAQQVAEGERLYAEGLALWHGRARAGPRLAFWRGTGGRRDAAGAIAKWRQAGERHHYLALHALAHALQIQGADDDLDSQANAVFDAWAIAEYRLGFVEAAEQHLRGEPPDEAYARQQARQLLHLASRLGDRRAAEMLEDRGLWSDPER